MADYPEHGWTSLGAHPRHSSRTLLKNFASFGRVTRKQKYSKMYTDFRRAAKKPSIVVGDTVRVKKPVIYFKGDLSFSSPRKVVEQRGPASFGLDDGRIWNSSKLSKVPAQAAQPRPVIQTPGARVEPEQPSGPSSVPSSARCESGQKTVPPGTPLSAVPSVLCSPRVASQETPQQAVPAPPAPEPPPRRVLPARTRRPPRRFMDYV